jgi:hypothetical protein
MKAKIYARDFCLYFQTPPLFITGLILTYSRRFATYKGYTGFKQVDHQTVMETQ